MAYWWRMDGSDPADLVAAGLDQRFDNQQRAEDWLTAFYPELSDRGVQRVWLYEEDRLVYGPMSLEA